MSKNFSLIDSYNEFLRNGVRDYGEKCVVLMQVGKFLEIYQSSPVQSDVDKFVRFGEEMGLTQMRRSDPDNPVSKTNYMAIGFPDYMKDKYIQVLYRLNYTAMVVLQFEKEISDGKSKKPKKIIERKIDRIYSPGTMIEVNDNVESCCLMSIYAEYYNNVLIDIAVSAIDITTGKSSCFVLELQTDLSDLCDEVAKLILFLKPKEILINVILPDNHLDWNQSKFLESISCENNSPLVLVNKLDKSKFTPSCREHAMSKIFEQFQNVHNNIIETLGLEKYPSTVISYIAMINFAFEHDRLIVKNLSLPIIDKKLNFLDLSTNCIQQLNLLDGNPCVFDLICKTSTLAGKRLLRQRLIKPYTDPNSILNSYDKVKKMLEISDEGARWMQFENHLNSIRDLERLHRKMVLCKLQPFEFASLHSSYQSIQNLLQIPDQEFDCSFKPHIEHLAKFIEDYSSQLVMISINKLSFATNNVYQLFNQEIDQEVDSASQQFKTFTTQMEEHRQKISQYAGESANISSTVTEGHHFVMSTKKIDCLKKSYPDFHKLTIKKLTNNSKVFCPLLQDISTNLIAASEKLNKLNKNRFEQFQNDSILQYGTTLTKITEWVAQQDVDKSIAKLSFQEKYTCPVLEPNQHKSSFIHANDCRHPVIEKINTLVPFVCNDIVLGQDHEQVQDCDSNSDSDSVKHTKNNNVDGILLFSPNSSGKTSYLRMVGICLILAQCGFFVPCSKFVYYPFTKIITKIAVQDNIYQNQSSFSKEVKDLKFMLDNSDEHSLILADELCNSSEHQSAVSLVAATIIKLSTLNTKFIFTTHFHELMDIKEIKQLDNVKPFQMKVSLENGVFIFDRKLMPGQCETLYGLEFAKCLHIPTDVMNIAFQIRSRINTLQIPDEVLPFCKTNKSRYNSQVIVDCCLICGSSNDLHTHHIVHQKCFNEDKQTDKNSFVFEKNIKHNLAVLCQSCHVKVHQDKLIVEGYQQTSSGVRLIWKNV